MSLVHRLAFALHRAPAPIADLARRWRDRGLMVAAGLQRGSTLGACRRCGLTTRLPGVVIGSDGRCRACRHAGDALPLPELPKLAAHWRAQRPRSGFDLVLTVSGGQDSALALALAVEDLGLAPMALLVRHAFLEAGAEARAQALCDRLGVPLHVHWLQLGPWVRQALASESLSPWPCLICAEAQARAALALCDRLGLARIGTGLRGRWPDRGSAVTTAPRAFRHFRVPHRPAVEVVNLIPGCGLAPGEQNRRLTSLGFRAPQDLGPSTNCELLSVFETLHTQRYGHGFETERVVAEELRWGTIDPHQAAQRLAQLGQCPTERVAAVHARAEVH